MLTQVNGAGRTAGIAFLHAPALRPRSVRGAVRRSQAGALDNHSSPLLQRHALLPPTERSGPWVRAVGETYPGLVPDLNSLDLEEIARLVLQLGERGSSPAPANRGLFVARMDEALLDAVLRMVRLLDTPEDAAVLGPVVQREIYYRMLRGDLAHRLLDLAQGEGGTHRIVRAIEWLKQHYAAPLRIDELADAVHMSSSALHHRFKAVTAMSPLQYQKHLRLHEARRLMFADGVDCATAGHRVGYESPSQFSREYRRLFGAPPRAEIERLRESGAPA